MLCGGPQACTFFLELHVNVNVSSSQDFMNAFLVFLQYRNYLHLRLLTGFIPFRRQDSRRILDHLDAKTLKTLHLSIFEQIDSQPVKYFTSGLRIASAEKLHFVTSRQLHLRT